MAKKKETYIFTYTKEAYRLATVLKISTKLRGGMRRRKRRRMRGEGGGGRGRRRGGGRRRKKEKGEGEEKQVLCLFQLHSLKHAQ